MVVTTVVPIVVVAIVVVSEMLINKLWKGDWRGKTAFCHNHGVC